MKILRLLLLFFVPIITDAQNSSSTKIDQGQLKELVRSYMIEHKSQWNLTDADISNWTISDLYSNKESGTTYLYVHQQVKGIRIFNAVSSVSIKNGKVMSFGKKIYSDAAGKINNNVPSITSSVAIHKAAEDLNLTLKGEPKLLSSEKPSHKYYYSSSGISKDKIRVELVFQPVKKSLRLAWDVNIHFIDGSHWWNVRIDAINGEVIQKNDWVTHCDFGSPADDNNLTRSNSSQASALSFIPPTQSNPSALGATYRVYPLPLEAPSFGPSALLPDPSDIIASPYGWHDTNGATGAEYTITRGNNVYAYDDIANTNAPGTSPDGTASLTFDFPINFTQAPSTYLSASLTNLFYLNNMVHDRLYHYGFDEAAGNFQQNNYGHNGQGNDYVVAEGQDGGGSNNANFGTPPDGQSGRMQMYLWSGNVPSVLIVNSPPSIAGNYNATPAGFGPAISTPITGDLVLVDDGTGTTTDACQPLVNGAALSGKIAVIDRGICNFVDKVLEAQSAGAIAVIMINNVPGILAMGDNGNGGSVTIPSEMITLADGNIFKASMAGGTVNATLNPPPPGTVELDGSLDNGVVIHEYGHGVSNRLTGGPSNTNCLSNGEQGGEGWSDYFAMMFTMKTGDSGTAARGMGTYALGEPTNGYGIRRYPYSTDMNVDPETYGFLAQSGEAHDVGEVWCTVLWEMTWGLVNQYGFDTDWINGTSGNNLSLRLVMEGMKLQPCGPGFLDGRDAILQADENLYGGIHRCNIWTSFAKRGMGYYADQGSADNTGDETEDFEVAPYCLVATVEPTANFSADLTNTCFGIVHFADSSTNTPQTWHWNFGDGDTSAARNPVHSYNITGTFTITLIVTNTIGADTLVRTNYITFSRPPTPTFTGDTSICSGTSAVLTANVSGGNSAEWRNSNDSILFVGNVFNTPAITSATAFSLTQFSPTAIQNVGPVDNTFGTGGYHNSGFEGKLNFTTFAPMRLKSIWVDASGDSVRTINLFHGATLLKSVLVNIPNGQSRVELNFDIPVSGDYQIGCSTHNNLYRNNASASYPYTINGLVSITSCNSPNNPTNFYYYFYNWEVQPLPCSSTPLNVNVSIDPDPTGNFTFVANGMNVQFTNTSTGSTLTYLWDFGNGTTSTAQSPSITYLHDSTYTVMLTVTSSNGCQSVITHLVTVPFNGINEIINGLASIYYTGHELVIKFQSAPADAKIRIYDPVGKLLINENFKGGKIYTRLLNDIASEYIMVTLEDGNNTASKKIILLN